MFPNKIKDLYNDDGTEKLKDNSLFRRRYIMMLDIPTYDKFKKVMFYDVLQ